MSWPTRQLTSHTAVHGITRWRGSGWFPPRHCSFTKRTHCTRPFNTPRSRWWGTALPLMDIAYGSCVIKIMNWPLVFEDGWYSASAHFLAYQVSGTRDTDDFNGYLCKLHYTGSTSICRDCQQPVNDFLICWFWWLVFKMCVTKPIQ